MNSLPWVAVRNKTPSAIIEKSKHLHFGLMIDMMYAIRQYIMWCITAAISLLDIFLTEIESVKFCRKIVRI